ncbi:MAG TPA: DoxX family protein [Terriglobia bacterium]|nr:DoxX family protein [Terriglobia bacterium]
MESRKRLWIGYAISGTLLLFLLFDSVGKLLKVTPVLEGSARLGYPESSIVGIGVVLLVCTVLFAIPKTSLFGAILLTGYLGGAVATHVRVGSPLWTHQLFPVYIGVLIWLALCLRNEKLRRFLSV